MAATTARMPSRSQTPLKTLNRGNNFIRTHRSSATAKRKSAVELLQESKAFYVKSETVLDRQQQLKHAGHLQVTSSPAVDNRLLRAPRYIQQHVVVLSPPPRTPVPPRSPRATPAQRRSGSHNSDQLQTKLRRLLNADSKENLFIGAWEDGATKTVDPDTSCSRHHKSLPDLHHACSASPISSPETPSRCCVRTHSLGSAMSTTSSGGKTRRNKISSRHGSPNRNCPQHGIAVHQEEVIDIIQPTTPNRESRIIPRRIAEGPPSASSWSDSGPDEPLSPISQHRDDNNWREYHRPILRSKSDISHRYSRGPPPPIPRPEPRSTEQLEKFFEQLGLDTVDYRTVSEQASGSSSPVYFDSVSSVDSAIAWGPWGSGSTSGNAPKQTEQLSIVERNARIIKWLCNCRKAQLAVHAPSWLL